MRHRLIFAAITILLLCLLTGCGKKETPCSGPVLGEACEGYEGYQYLKEATLNTKNGPITVFLPKGLTLRPGKGGSGGSCDGISIRIGQTSAKTVDFLLPEQCQEWVLAECEAENLSRAAGFTAARAQCLDNGSVRIPVSYYEIYEKPLKIHRTYCIRKLDNDTILFLEINVASASITEKTEGILRELEHFYQFEIASDQRAVRQMAEAARRRRQYARHSHFFLFPMPWYPPENAKEPSGICLKSSFAYNPNPARLSRYTACNIFLLIPTAHHGPPVQ